MSRAVGWWWLSVACLCAPAVQSQFDPARLDPISAGPTVDGALARIDGDLRTRFDEALQAFDDHAARRPFDVVAQLDKCRFMDEFTDTYEAVEWIEDVYAMAEDCGSAVAARFPEHPEVELRELEQMWGEEQLSAGRAIIEGSSMEIWSSGQRARLTTLLATTADNLELAEAAHWAEQALRFDEAAGVRLILAEHLIDANELERAAEVLTSPADRSGADNHWYTLAKMRLLARLQRRDDVVRLHEKVRGSDAYYNHIAAADALGQVGAIDLARAELEHPDTTSEYSTEGDRARFLFEFEHGDSGQALAAYESLRDRGWQTDPLGINRAALLARDLSLPWRWRDAMGIVGLLLTLSGISAVAALPVLLVHYRGLALRVGREWQPYDGWSLRHAWFAMSLFATASVVALYFGGTIDITAAAGDFADIDATPEQIARLLLAHSMLALFLLLPLAQAGAAHPLSRTPLLLATRWHWFPCLIVGAAIAVLLQSRVLLNWSSLPELVRLFANEDLVWSAALAIREHVGLGAALWVLVVAAPVTEEFLFRGILLRSFSGHVAFALANLLQAALFALMHMNAAGFPKLLLVGLLGGWLARRSGGLLAPIAMHAVFNLILASALR